MSNIEYKKEVLRYNRKSAKSILEYGTQLLNLSLRQLHPDAEVNRGKGGLGNAVEFFHYGIEANSESEPDFREAGLELKCTPLKILSDGSMSSKERLVLNIINYIEESDKNFESSSFWHKNKFLLLMFYLHEKGVDPVDMVFKMIRTYKFPSEDLKIIRDDWNKIHEMILSGHAEEITEGITFYLAACMKGSKAGVEMRKQPYSNKPAQQRAYSLKQGYMNKILLDSYLDKNIQAQLHLTLRRVSRLQKKYASEKIAKNKRAYKKNETFEMLIERKMKPYYGKTLIEIEKKTHVVISPNKKDNAYDVCRAILGIKTKKIQEFENAQISLKTITLEANRTYAKESMSFPYIRYVDIVKEEWEQSSWYKTLNSKFLFAVFRKSPDGDKSKKKFEKIFFWNMPKSDLDKAKQLWIDTRDKIEKGDYNHFITSKKASICHVRPHGTKYQKVITPEGEYVQPKCFWLNNTYILDFVKKELKLEDK